jgi:hypothetical protein
MLPDSSSLSDISDDEDVGDELVDEQNSSSNTTPKPKCTCKRRRVFGQKRSKSAKKKLESARSIENSKAAVFLDIAIGDEIILHPKSDASSGRVQRFGEFEFSEIQSQFSDIRYELFGCTPVGVWTVFVIEDGLYHIQSRYTTANNPAYLSRRNSQDWGKELADGYKLGPRTKIGAYEILHRLMDKTAVHVRTTVVPPRSDTTLQALCLRVLAKTDSIPLERDILPSHLLEDLKSRRKEIFPIPIECRILFVAQNYRTGKNIKAPSGDTAWTKKSFWRICPKSVSYEKIWLECARKLVPSVPTAHLSGLCLEPEQGTAAFMAEYLVACCRCDRNFKMTIHHVWEIDDSPRYGGCIGGNNVLFVRPAAHPAVSNGSILLPAEPRLVRDVRAGDVVVCEAGDSTVIATWRAPSDEPARPMVSVRDVWLTPDHPVLASDGRWCRADELAPRSELRETDAVYNFAVSSLSGVIVAAPGATSPAGSVVCCTLGQAVPSMADAVWGTPIILAWMRAQPDWPDLDAPIPLLRPVPAQVDHGHSATKGSACGLEAAVDDGARVCDAGGSAGLACC